MASESATLLAELIAIDSVNPALVPGGAGEAAIAAHVAAWLERAGLEVRLDEIAPGRPNVIATARGTGGGRSLILNAHTDTVGAGGMADPFEPRVEGDRMHGRGSFDMKAGLAAAMCAGAALARRPAAGDVIVTAVVDEEHASIGSAAVARHLRADGAIVTEPTGENVCVAHKGFVWLEVETAGRAAHGSLPDAGVDAIARMGSALVALEELDTELARRAPHALVGRGSVHASLIEGGQELSSYPERCLLQIERRTLPGESADDVERELRGAVAARWPAGREAPEVRATLSRPPFAVAQDAPIVEAVRAAARAVCGAEPGTIGHPAWMDAALLAQAGIPTVIYGPGGDGAHAVVEWADLPSLERTARVLEDAARAFCGGG